MRRFLPLWVRCRAAIAMVALYALVLQPFLAAASVVTMPDAPGVICEAGHGGSQTDRDTGGRHDGSCCIAATAPPIAAPPDPYDTVARGPLPRDTRIVHSPETRRREARPPTHAWSARGPPRG